MSFSQTLIVLGLELTTFYVSQTKDLFYPTSAVCFRRCNAIQSTVFRWRTWDNNKQRICGYVVSVLAFNSDDPRSFPAEVDNFSAKLLSKKEKIGPLKNLRQLTKDRFDPNPLVSEVTCSSSQSQSKHKFLKHRPNPASFCLSFSQYNDLYYTKFEFTKRVDGVSGIQTRDRRMVSADEVSELWRPSCPGTILRQNRFFCCNS